MEDNCAGENTNLRLRGTKIGSLGYWGMKGYFPAGAQKAWVDSHRTVGSLDNLDTAAYKEETLGTRDVEVVVVVVLGEQLGHR